MAAAVLAALGFRHISTAATVKDENTEALARMLASETSSIRAKEYLAVITVRRAIRAKRTLLQLITSGDGYGAQKRGDKSYYASTRKAATKKDYEISEAAIAGRVKLDPALDLEKVGSWVERGAGAADLTRAEQDTLILARQHIWREGVTGIINGTDWVIFSKAEKPRGRAELAEIAKRYSEANDSEGRLAVVKVNTKSEDTATLENLRRFV